ncbi:MAG TPA: class I SAM-dependent methyltransferase [Bryobacteraceae bacterium]|nr:class I SAM-dependent methyltransferase [Bryobacteraceae bacterium]
MSLNPTERFSSRVADYVRYRPSYPPGIVPLLARECGLTSESVIADVASGTGLLARLFSESGYRVIGVEPNAEMRAAGDVFLAAFPKFRSVDGRAEQTGLPDTSVDLITVGQAFHWFDAAATRREFRRILRPPRQVALIWNERIVPTSGFLKGYEDMLHRYVPDYGKIDHRQVDAQRIAAFFGHSDWTLAVFENAQEFDLEGVSGRLLSSSYAPDGSSPNYQPMLDELERIFAAHNLNGRVSFLYDTKVYYGELP